MLTVIGAGFPRTGTSSMKAALERLGFGPCHHMFDIMTNPHRVDRWLPLAEGAQVDWGYLLEGFHSTQDWPASFFWREQAEAYPEAKVVLTVRDPRAWCASMRTLIDNGPRRAFTEKPSGEASAFFQGIIRLQPVLDLMAGSVFGSGRAFREGLIDEESAVAAFERHVATVKESLPAERLLVFDVREGWAPLCRFLGVDVPEGEPFPHLNDSASMPAMMDRLMKEGSAASPFARGT